MNARERRFDTTMVLVVAPSPSASTQQGRTQLPTLAQL